MIAVFPPKRRSDDLRANVHAAFTLGEANLRQSLLPDSVELGDRILTRPEKWR